MENGKWQYRKLSELTKLENNPRTITKEDFEILKKSISDNKDYFEARPLILSNRTGQLVIIGGNQRYEASKALGLEEVPTYLLENLTEEKEKEIIIRDNVNNGDFDWDKLANEWEQEKLEEWGLDTTKDWSKEVVEDEAPEVSTEPAISKLGEIYQVGRHRVMCGDSTKIEDVTRLMDGKKADMVFTDPPYGMDLDTDYSGMKGWHQGKKYNNVIGDHSDFNNDFINNIFSVFSYVKEKFLFGADYYVDLLPNYGKDGSWVVLDKRDDESKDKMFGSGFEMLWSQEKHQRRILRGQWAGFMGDKEARNRFHPTQKPTKILSEIIQEYSSSEQIVIDLFLGSGSTLIACEQINRTCYGMELDPKYCDVIRKRYAKFVYPDRWEKEWERLTPCII